MYNSMGSKKQKSQNPQPEQFEQEYAYIEDYYVDPRQIRAPRKEDEEDESRGVEIIEIL